MAPFRATSVAALDFDFRPLVDTAGTIPEPSHDLRDAFLMRLDNAVDGPGELEDRLGNVTLDELHRLEAEFLGAIVDLGQGTPKLEDLQALPPRHQLAFLGWLTGQLTNPT